MGGMDDISKICVREKADSPTAAVMKLIEELIGVDDE